MCCIIPNHLDKRRCCFIINLDIFPSCLSRHHDIIQGCSREGKVASMLSIAYLIISRKPGTRVMQHTGRARHSVVQFVTTGSLPVIWTIRTCAFDSAVAPATPIQFVDRHSRSGGDKRRGQSTEAAVHWKRRATEATGSPRRSRTRLCQIQGKETFSEPLEMSLDF